MKIKYAMIITPSIILYQPKILKLFFCTYCMKNLITASATIKETIKPTAKTEIWPALKSARYFSRLQTEAAIIVGIARKKENSVATTREAPKIMAPTIVARTWKFPGS